MKIFCCGLLFVLFTVVFGSISHGQIASALLREGEPLPGDMLGVQISAINNTATNAVGGYAFTVTTDGSFSNVWGNLAGGAGTVLRAEETIGNLEITGFESFFGISDTGQIAYGTTTNDLVSGETGLDGVFLDATVVLNERDPVATLPGEFSTFNSRPGITASGIPYWVGGVANAQGATTQDRVLFLGTALTPVFRGNQNIVGIPETATTSGPVDFDVRFSALGTNYINVVDVNAPAASNVVVVSNGEVMMAGGSIIREGTLIPAAAGGIGDNYSAFDFLGINESGSFMITGNSNAAAATNEFVMIDGEIVLREGGMVGAGTLAGDIEGGFMNEDGDWAVIWDAVIDAVNREVLIVNGELVLVEGDAVDWNGDGMIDAADEGAVLTDFTGITSLTMSRRDAMGMVRLYFTADAVTVSGTLEGGFELTYEAAKIIKGDVNGDGEVNLLDIAPFVELLTSGGFQAEADINMDGLVNLLDVSLFVALLSGD